MQDLTFEKKSAKNFFSFVFEASSKDAALLYDLLFLFYFFISDHHSSLYFCFVVYLIVAASISNECMFFFKVIWIATLSHFWPFSLNYILLRKPAAIRARPCCDLSLAFILLRISDT